MSLISTTDAALIIYFWNDGWKQAFNPKARAEVFAESEKQADVYMRQAFIENAIKSGELPAIKKSQGKVASKEVLNAAGVPEEFHDKLQQYDYWITLEDLFVFMERPHVISKDYAHGRDSLARIICALMPEEFNFKHKELSKYLAQQIEDAETNLSKNLSINKNTLDGACREIIDSFHAMKKNSD